ncbi:hypothetical protein ACIHFC_30715 [Streptomyces sp. NPDC052013]|uniref:hypothetical protein n=1 Tax=Streptomyces sp. NPDC052013 TaxID=3365679 RepID=UPI0037D4B035
MPPQRAGGQAQFVEYRVPDGDAADLGDTSQWMRGKLSEPLSLADIAAHATMSRRSLCRHFPSWWSGSWGAPVLPDSSGPARPEIWHSRLTLASAPNALPAG